MESKIDKAKRLLERYQKDRRINVVPLTSAFDVAQKIINHTKEDKDYYQEDPALQQLFKDRVFDAWGNIIALEAEMKANTMTKEMMDILSGLASDDSDVTFDQFQAAVQNHRVVLNELIEHDKDAYNEVNLLKAVEGLLDVNDPDAINLATREAQNQIDNILVSQQNVEALKEVYDVFSICIEKKFLDVGEPCLALVQKYSHIVVHLGAIDDNSAPLRQCLQIASKVAQGIDVTEVELQLAIDTVIRPMVMRGCSNPPSEEV